MSHSDSACERYTPALLPRSLTAVNPENKRFFISGTLLMATSSGGIRFHSAISSSLDPKKCICASTSPGRMVKFGPSMTFEDEWGNLPSPISTILPVESNSTHPSSIVLLPSKILPLKT